MPFQENLRHYREKAGYSQAKDFAAAIGVKYSTYIGYENQGREPKYDTLCLIAATLNVSIDTLLGFSGVDRYEEYRQLLERSGCQVVEDATEKIHIVLYLGELLEINKLMQSHIKTDNAAEYLSSTIFESKADFCACITGILSNFENMLASAKAEYIPLALLGYIAQKTGTSPYYRRYRHDSIERPE